MTGSILVFCVGLFFGGIGGWYVARVSSPASPFEEGGDEADELRTEATEVVQKRIEKRKNRIVAKAHADGRITNDGIEDMFCISDRTAGRYLGELVDEGKLQKVGTRGRGVYYTPVAEKV